jgi:hypothetical protein
MVKHIVMWQLKNEVDGKQKPELTADLKKMLLALKNDIPQIVSIEVGINDINHDKNHDLVLITEFKNYDDLATYANHPKHLQVVDFVAKVRTTRAAVDFEF